MNQESPESVLNRLLTREEIDRIVAETGVTEGDNTLDLEYRDEAGEKHVIRWMKLKDIMTEEGLKTTAEDILATKARLGL